MLITTSIRSGFVVIAVSVDADMRGDLLERHVVAERIGGADDHHHGRGGERRFGDDLPKLRDLELAIDEKADRQRIGGDDRAGFGRREYAVAQAEDDNEGNGQRPACLPQRGEDFARATPCGREPAGSRSASKENSVVTMSTVIMVKPGTMPAMNSLPTDTLAR